MNRRTTAAVFFAIAAFLYATRYIAAAIFGSGVNSWDSNLFQAMLSYVGRGPLVWAAAAAILGVVYLAWAELADRRH